MANDLGTYLWLVSSWHSDKPKFMSTIAALVQPLIDAQTMLAALTADFDLDTAVGVQLDAVGQWIGRTRYVTEPVTGVFFGFNAPNPGFNKGVWLGPYSNTDALVALDDETYRSVLKLQAIANSWDGTVPSMSGPLNNLFPGIVVQDMGDTTGGLMTMDVLIPSHFLSQLLLAVLEQDFPVRPSGVLVNIIETTVQGVPIFAFNLPYTGAGGPFGGFNQGAWGEIVQSQ
jgi:hypothetical protein